MLDEFKTPINDRVPIGKFKYTSPITGHVTEGEYYYIDDEPPRYPESRFKKIYFILSTVGIGYELNEVEIEPYDSARSI